MNSETINFFYDPRFSEHKKEFFRQYDLENIIVPGGSEQYFKSKLTKKNERTCLFCSQRMPSTTFNNLSHLLPQMMGNGNLYSDFECDQCNEKFSLYENDLSEFLGVSRSVSGVGGEGRTKGFKARRLRAASRSLIGENVLIIAPDDIKQEDNKFTFSYLKNPFTPSNVYKALLKCALSVLARSEVEENYQGALKYLTLSKPMFKGAFICGYNLPYATSLPLVVFHFRRKVKDPSIPADVILFHFQNRLIVFPLIFHKEDNPRNMVMPPPVFAVSMNVDGLIPTFFNKDLSSHDRVVDEEENLILLIDPDYLKTAVVYNPANERVPASVIGKNGIKYMIITRGGASFKPKELSEFIKKQLPD